MNTNWKPMHIEEISRLKSKADCAYLFDDEQGLKIEIVFENDSKAQFLFDTSVLSYNVCDEGDRLMTIAYLINQYGSGFLGEGPVFIVDNSAYLKWFNEESSDIYLRYDVKHYVFMTSNEIVDVLSTYPPEIKINH